MKKTKKKEYSKINYKKSRWFRKQRHERRKEKFIRFVTLPSFIWTVTFLLFSIALLFGSYFINQVSTWLSGVLVSIACGMITGVVLYFLSNLRANKMQALKADYEEIYSVYQPVVEVLWEIQAYLQSKKIGEEIDFHRAGNSIVEKLDAVLQASDGTTELFGSTDGLNNLFFPLQKIVFQHEELQTEEDIQKWFVEIDRLLNPAIRIMTRMMDESGDKIQFMKKSVF